MSDVPPSPRLDAKAIRVLAHPLRSRLLSRLRLEGPATATKLAKALDTNTGATSYQLRKLADVGLVDETGEGRGRERVWRSAHRQHSFFETDFEGDPDSKAASEWLHQEQLRHFHERVEQWQRTRADWPVEWRDPAGMSDYFLDISADQFSALMAEIGAAVARYRNAGPGEGSQRVFLYVHASAERRNAAR